MSATTPVAITSSTNASPIVVTSTAHGFATGDSVVVIGHATNTAANGTWEVTKVTANTYSLTKNIKSGVISTGNGIGGATGINYLAPKRAMSQDFRNSNINFASDNSANLTAKLVASDSETCPDFAQSQSPSNSYEFIAMVDLEDSTNNVVGDTGIILAGTDASRGMEANVNGKRWMSAILTAWSAGDMTIRIRLFDNQ